MKEDQQKIEKRLQNMRNFYVKLCEMVDGLPHEIPEKARNKIKDVVLGDKDLKQLMDGIESHRPPRFFLIGRTGVGKSSLINALINEYAAKVSDTRSCTECAQTFQYKKGNSVLMEILDTRGIAESERIDESISAEDMLVTQINQFSPDVAILMLNCTHRDDVNSDVVFLTKLSKTYEKINKQRLPIVVVVNKCDEMAPSREKDPSKYSELKIRKINEVVQNYNNIINNNGLKIDGIIPVSSLIEWMTPDGISVDVESINDSGFNYSNLQVSFDGRFKIEDLVDLLDDSIPDYKAKMGLRMAVRLNSVVNKIAKHLIQIFSVASSAIALTPIPISDIYILISIQSLMVALIAYLSGREISLDVAKEFIVSTGGVTGAGYIFRLIAQQGVKLLNPILPGSGSLISSGIAGFGTSSIGKAAVTYYLNGKSIENAKKELEESQNDYPDYEVGRMTTS